MKNYKSNYYVVHSWMNELGLKGLQKELYAIIYGFSQDGNSKFYGSLSYLEHLTGYSRPTIITALTKLVNENLIFKQNGTPETPSAYNVNLEILQVVKKFNYQEKTTDLGSKEILQEVVKKFNKGSKEILPNINTNINKDNKMPKRKILFKNSKYINKQSVIDDFLKMKEADRKQYGGAYIPYYIQVVNEWSEAKEVKRTERGWFATIKQFIRRDKENNKLMTKSNYNKIFSKGIDRSNSNLV